MQGMPMPEYRYQEGQRQLEWALIQPQGAQFFKVSDEEEMQHQLSHLQPISQA